MQTRQGSWHCPVCKAELFSALGHSARGDVLPVNCPNCGPYELSDSADAVLHAHPTPQDRARLAYCIRRLPPSTLLTANLIEKMLKSAALPTPMERLDNVILRMAKIEPGTATDLLPLELRATIGTESDEGALWALRQARALDYLEGDESHLGKFKATLTAKGWQRHAELMRDGAASRHAFMAMKFNDPDLDRVYWEHFKPAVEATGFELRRTDEGHKTAGLIDNRMRVEIRTSRFLLCDLSHGNAGAYWEAGFAEGLGRPVLFTCRRDVVDHKDHPHHPHFDTAHQPIIRWEMEDPRPAMQELKDMIRATLPAEARMEEGTGDAS